MKPTIYLIGSLRNPQIPVIANLLRSTGQVEVFDDWYAAGPEADDKWREYEQGRGRSYAEALKGKAARNVFQFDRGNLNGAHGALLVLPAGRSGHLELGYMAGREYWTGVLLEKEGDPDRWDVMYQFARWVGSDPQEALASFIDCMFGDNRGDKLSELA